MKKIILVLILALISLPIFSQSSAGRFSLKNIDTYWESTIPASNSYWIPKVKLFGNNTTLTDSTNYLTLNKGFYAFDSIKTDKDLIVKGKVVLDTLRELTLEASGLNLQLTNVKENGSQVYSIGNKNSNYAWYKTSGSGSASLMQLDTINGLVLTGYNISTSSTGQIKIPTDTASDFNGDDAITLNRQSGTLTTKALTTAAGGLYALTLTNSLITTNSRIFASLNDGTLSTGLTVLYQCRPGSGSGTIVIYNASGADAFNGTIKIYFVVFN